MPERATVTVMTDVETAVRTLYRALEDGLSGARLLALMTDDVVTVEHPNAPRPSGGTADREAMRVASTAGAQLLETQRYDVRDVIVSGDVAAVRCTWSAVVARDAGPFRRGQRLRAHLAQFVTLRGGLVSRIETYDCHEVAVAD